MADDLKIVRDIFKNASVPLSENDVWAVQGTPVVKHKALERLAAALHIKWHAPQVLIAKSDEAVVVAMATLNDKPDTEWSIGEAKVVPMTDTGRKNKWGKPLYEAAEGAIGNYQITPKQAAYPFAMAEKRAKDRVILKLAGLQGVYSEEESDDFHATNETRDEPSAAPPKPRAEPIVTSGKTNGHAPAAPMTTEEKQRTYITDFMTWLGKATDLAQVRGVWREELPSMNELGITGTPLEAELKSAWTARGNALARAAGNPNAPAN